MVEIADVYAANDVWVVKVERMLLIHLPVLEVPSTAPPQVSQKGNDA